MRWQSVKLIQCCFSSGRHRAFNTAASHLRAIQAFYTYAKTRDLDIDDAILTCHFEAILALLDG
jgi:hypothetical protein